MITFAGCNCKVDRGNFSIKDIPLDCPAVWRLIGGGHTVGVFQLEKKLGQDWAKKVRPDSIEELAALTALLRPGCLESGMSDDYVDIKFGKKKNEYLHPKLEPILGPTYGCLVYQEQAIRIATDLAGLSPEVADDLRKAIGKKIPELMAKIKAKFIDGCISHSGISQDVAEKIFGWIEKSQRYSFNLSHAISYGMIAYQTAWSKCHFPREFFTSYLTYSQYKSDPKEEIYKLVQDARLFGIDIFPPDIRRGNIHFQMTDLPSEGIAFGLAHIRGVGSSAIEKILSVADTLDTWADFLSAVPSFHRNVGVALIKSGACDCYNMPRSEMVRELEVILGTTVYDSQGKKVDIKGLTSKEAEYFFDRLKEGEFTTREILIDMSQPATNKKKRLSQMNKQELVDAAREYLDQVATVHKQVQDGDGVFVYSEHCEKQKWLEDLSSRKKAELQTLMEQNGYKDIVIKSPCSTDARREIVAKKATLLKDDIQDSSRAIATAEKHFLGIALSCSEADDIEDGRETHTCLDIAKAHNDEEVVTRVIIDNVKHTKTKRGQNPGQPMCFLTISDSTYSIDHAVVFPDAFQSLKELCKPDIISLISGKKRNGSFIINDIKKLI